MRNLNILMIALLVIYLIIGGVTIYHVYYIYRHVAIPPQILKQLVYPYQLFEGLCLLATLYALNRFIKKDYKPGVWVAFAAIILSGLFFAIHK